MKFWKISNITVNIILLGHIIIAIIYGIMLFRYVSFLDDPKPDINGAVGSTYHRTFKFWFLDYRLDYQYTFDKEMNEEEHIILIFDIAELSPRNSTNNNLNIELFNKNLKETVNFQIQSSPIFIPFNHDQEINLFILLSMISFLVICYSFIVFYLIKRIVDSIKIGSPFINKNVKLLFQIGLMVLSLPVVIVLVDICLYNWITDTYNFHGFIIHPNFNFNLELFTGGILLIFIAEIFKHGVKLREDQELTI